MKAEHFEFLIEEPSMEAFLNQVLPKIVGDGASFTLHVYQGKRDLLKKLTKRLRGYANSLSETTRIVVLVDRDEDDCRALKQRLEDAALAAGLSTRSNTTGTSWRVVNRIAIEELEAWFFGNWANVRKAYPKLPASPKAAHRNCDAIAGGTSEALEKVMQEKGYFPGGLRKVEAAKQIGEHFDPDTCVSPSFIVFKNALTEALTAPD